MPTPAEKLAQSLEVLGNLQQPGGKAALRAKDLSRTHRERLLINGFLREVIKGWYIPSRPEDNTGESTPWYASFWKFCAAYLNDRFGTAWCLSPEQSLSYLAGNRTVPRQLMVRSPRARNRITAFPHNTSLFDVRAALPNANDLELRDDLRLFSPEAALIACSPRFFASNPTDIRAVLLTMRDASSLLRRLLEGGHSTIAGRLVGAFRNCGRERIADDIAKTMTAAGYEIRESDPFADKPGQFLSVREASPYVHRIQLMWQKMRAPILELFPQAPGRPRAVQAYLKRVDDAYLTDAYHSLSIEGYRVTPELIERVRIGAWNPDADPFDREQRNAMAARGYWQAYQAVLDSVRKVLQGENAGEVADHDHGAWYRELFAPSVAVGLLNPADLAGYRNTQVFIRNSMHVPMNSDAVRDALPVLFDMLCEEQESAVRVVLGHFLFVYIHPYMDGNGRMGRFLMNVMLSSGGYPWTVIPVGERTDYMSALEQASVQEDIVPFTRFLGGLVDKSLRGEPYPPLP